MKIVFSLLIFFTSGSFAQVGKISGSVKGQSALLEAATVTLLQNDSSVYLQRATNADGLFQFSNLPIGSYFLKITAAGFEPQFSSAILLTADKSWVEMNNIILKTKNTLKEVVVNARKNTIERKADKVIMNVDASIANTGTTVLEMLERAPGVSVDKDGNINMQGKKGVIVMIDGKPSFLTGIELTDYLRNLPSSNLDQVEIMTNPSARYDASGNSGIINLKTKKIRQKGFNGSLSTAYTQGFYPKTTNSLSLNYRINKFNVFSTLSANYRKNFQDLDIFRIYKNPDGSVKAIFDQESRGIKERENYTARFGMDYYASKKTTIGFSVSGFTTPGGETGFNTNLLQNGSGTLDSIVTANRKENYTFKNGSLNLNFRHVFDSTGKELSADMDYLQYNSQKNQFFINSNYDASHQLLYADELKGELPSDIKVYAAKIDYTQNIFKNIRFETGVKSSFVATDNTASYFNIINGNKSVDYEKTNHFRYRENINAGYINFNRTLKQWSFQAGLRVENTIYDGRQDGNPTKTDSSFSRSYTSAFPTAYVSYNANEKHQFKFSAGRRINRPDYEDLNPFLFFLDKYTYESGNPFLRPMYSNVFELAHTFKQNFTTTLNYSHTTDLFDDIFYERGFKTIHSEGNFGVNDNVSLSLSTQLNIFKWWKANVYAEGNYVSYKANIFGQAVNVTNYNYLSNFSNQFNFKKGWSAELTAMYKSKFSVGQINIADLGQLNVGVQKMIFKDKGSFKLSGRNILNTMNPSGKVLFNSTIASFNQRGDNRTFTISFNYRFGKPIKGTSKRKTGGASEEQNRIKSANG